MKEYKICILIILLTLSLFIITGCSKKELTIENKIDTEIEFCESRILTFLKEVDLEYYKKEDTLDWEKIKEENNIFIDSVPVIEADLSYIHFDDTKIQDIKNVIENIKNCVELQDINKLKFEYGNLFNKIITIKNNKNRELKNLCMKIYVESLSQNDIEISNLILELENKYDDAKKDNEFLNISNLSLNKIKDNISDLRINLEQKDYQGINNHCIKLIEIM